MLIHIQQIRLILLNFHFIKLKMFFQVILIIAISITKMEDFFSNQYYIVDSNILVWNEFVNIIKNLLYL